MKPESARYLNLNGSSPLKLNWKRSIFISRALILMFSTEYLRMSCEFVPRAARLKARRWYLESSLPVFAVFAREVICSFREGVFESLYVCTSPLVLITQMMLSSKVTR